MRSQHIQSIIGYYDLKPHPEGGFYKRVYESSTIVHYRDYASRPMMTSIYYLLASADCSHFHRLDADEMWNYYEGNTNLILHIFYKDNTYQKAVLGQNSQQYQFCVPAQSWVAAELEIKNEESYALLGCTVSPGFLFETFKLAKKSELMEQYPEHKMLITKMTLD